MAEILNFIFGLSGIILLTIGIYLLFNLGLAIIVLGFIFLILAIMLEPKKNNKK